MAHRTTARCFLLAVIGLAVLGGGPEGGARPAPTPIPHDHGHPLPDARSCVCDSVRIHNGWCTHCAVGYMASVRIPSPAMFDILDAHGHAVDLSRSSCPACPSAWRSDGFCDRCRIGYVDGRAYVSRLTYLLAKAETAPEPAACRTCRKNAESSGWCERCRRGFVGSFAFRVRSDFNEAAAYRARLVSALEFADRCEFCAVGAYQDGRCPDHRIHFQGGRMVTAQSPPAPEKETTP